MGAKTKPSSSSCAPQACCHSDEKSNCYTLERNGLVSAILQPQPPDGCDPSCAPVCLALRKHSQIILFRFDSHLCSSWLHACLSTFQQIIFIVMQYFYTHITIGCRMVQLKAQTALPQSSPDLISSTRVSCPNSCSKKFSVVIQHVQGTHSYTRAKHPCT